MPPAASTDSFLSGLEIESHISIWQHEVLSCPDDFFVTLHQHWKQQRSEILSRPILSYSLSLVRRYMFFCATSVRWKSDFQLHDTSFLELCAPRFLFFYIICFLFFQMSMRSLMNLILVFLKMMLADFLLFTCLPNKLSELSRRMSRVMVDGSRDPSFWIILMNVADFAVQDFQ